MDHDILTGAPRDPAATAARYQRKLRRELIITAGAVVAVAVAALLAVFAAPPTEHVDVMYMTKTSAPATAAGDKSVVTAPPLAAAQPDMRASMGAGTACSNCGTVENVVAIHGSAQGKVSAIGFLMNIRMDDGSVRTVEQRGAMAAGSRVMVDGGRVRVLLPSS